MRILLLTINYSPEPTGFAPHAAALAEHLAAQGHSVTVCTGFPFAPSWRRWPEFGRRFVSRQVTNSIELVRVSHFIPRTPSSLWQRLAMEATFSVAAGLALVRSCLSAKRRFEAVLYVGAQPGLALLSRCIAHFIRAPYFVNINDLAADAASDVKIVRRRWQAGVLRRIEFFAYRGAAGATVLCASFAEALMSNGYAADRIRLIRSPIDTASVRPVPRDPKTRQRLGIHPEAFVILFAGSMGLKQGLSNVIDAAALTRRSRGVVESRLIQWVLVGDGEARTRLVQLVRRHQVDDELLFVSFQPKSDISAMFAAADVLLVNQLLSMKDTVIPSKLLTYMAAGKPVLAAVNPSSQGAEILRGSGGGLLVAPESPTELARGAKLLMHMRPEDLAAMGVLNRAYAEEHFDQKKVLALHEAFITERIRSA